MTALLDTPPAPMPTIGSSEVAAVLGMSPWSSPWEVWARLVGLVPRYDQTGSDATRRGNMFEPAIGVRYAQEHNLVIGIHMQTGPAIGQPPLVRPDAPWMSCRPDFYAMPPCDEARLVEAKTARYLDVEEGWGEAGTDRVPRHYQIQLIWLMAVTDWHRVDLAAFATGNDEWRIYTLRRSERVEKAVVDRARDWYERHIVEGHPPMIDGTPACARVLALQHDNVDKAVFVDGDARDRALHRDLVALRRQMDALQTRRQRVENQLRARIGDAYGLRVDGEVLATWPAVKASAKRKAGRMFRPVLPESINDEDLDP